MNWPDLKLWFLQESTNLKAIHNRRSPVREWGKAVIPTGKYQFESNSQRHWPGRRGSRCCDSYRKVPIWKQFTTAYRRPGYWGELWFLQESTNLKAIHNAAGSRRADPNAVIPTGKYQFESNSQPSIRCWWFEPAVIPTGKYQFESNSQPHPQKLPCSARCDSYRKVPIWKQFTTMVVTGGQLASCDSYRKVPIWKQFTTGINKYT